MTNTRSRHLCPLTGILETTVLFVDESYLCKECAGKADTAYFKNSMEVIHKQKTKVSLRLCVCVCVYMCVYVCVFCGCVCVCVCVCARARACQQKFSSACSNGQFSLNTLLQPKL